MTFAERLRELRGMYTQRETADFLGVKYTSYINWEKGREPNYKTLIEIADYYKVPVDYLIGRTDYITPAHEKVALDTGLSQEAVLGIMYIKENNLNDALDVLLSFDEMVALEEPRITILLRLIKGKWQDSLTEYLSNVSLPYEIDSTRLYRVKDMLHKGMENLDAEHLLDMLHDCRVNYPPSHDIIYIDDDMDS